MFYLNDTKFGKPWKVVQRVQHKGVYDVPEVVNGEPRDLPEFDDAFQLDETTEFIPVVFDDNDVQYCREDVESEVIPNVNIDVSKDIDYDRDDEIEYDHRIDSDNDMDINIDNVIDNDMDYEL